MSKATARYMAGADAAFSKLVKWRDGYECQRCQTDQYLQCAHLISRSYKSIRTELENATTLCRSCHMYFTHHPLKWEWWCEAQGQYLPFDGVVIAARLGVVSTVPWVCQGYQPQRLWDS